MNTEKTGIRATATTEPTRKQKSAHDGQSGLPKVALRVLTREEMGQAAGGKIVRGWVQAG